MRFLSIVTIVLGSGLFVNREYNLLRISFIDETTILFLLFFTFIYFLNSFSSKKSIPSLGIFLLLLCFISLIFSSLFANSHFGQPIYLGLISERKTLFCLSFFPAYYFLTASRGYPVAKLLKIIFYLAVLSSMIGLWIYLTSEISNTSAQLRQNRAGIATGFVCIAIIIAFVSIYFNRDIIDIGFSSNTKRLSFYYISMFLLIFQLIFVAQTRQFIIGLGLSLFLIIVFSKKSSMLSFRKLVFAFVAILIVYNLDWSIVSSVFSENYLNQSARSQTFQVIINEFYEAPFLAKGALSPSHNGGFPLMYHDWFFLADVGIFGTLYRFGIIGVIIVLAYLFVLCLYLYNLRDSIYKKFLIGYFGFAIICLPVGALIEHRGFVFGIMCAILSYLIRQNSAKNTNINFA